jgi:hypothetical protein
MNENEKAKLYNSLMSQYITVENEISSVPKLSLEEQMLQVDATHKQLYSPQNQLIVDNLKRKLMLIEGEAKRIQLG